MILPMELYEPERTAYLKMLEDYLSELKSMPDEELRRKSLQNLVASKILKEDGSFAKSKVDSKEYVSFYKDENVNGKVIPELKIKLFERESEYIQSILDDTIEKNIRAIKEDYNNFVEKEFRKIGFSLSELADERYEKERQITIFDGATEMHEFFINGECVLKFKRTIIHDGLDVIKVRYEPI